MYVIENEMALHAHDFFGIVFISCDVAEINCGVCTVIFS